MYKRFFLVSIIFVLTIITVIQSAHFSVQAKTVEEIEKEIKQIEKEKMQLEQQKETIDQEKSATSEQIQQNLNEQSTIKDELAQIDQSLTTTKQDIDNKEAEISRLNTEINELTTKVTNIEEEIDTLHKEIKQLNTEISDLEIRLAKREDILKERLRSMQSGGGSIKYLEVLLGSQSFTDFISRTAAVSTIMKQDQRLMDEHKEDKQLLEGKRVSVEAKSDELNENREELIVKQSEIEENKGKVESERQQLVALQQELDRQASEKDRLLGQLIEEEELLVDYEISLEDEQRIIAAQVTALEKARQLEEQEKARLEQLAKEEAERKKQEQDGESDDGEGDNTPPPVADGSKIFIKPTDGRISSRYGMRVHPIYYTPRMHYGLDFARYDYDRANGILPPIKAAATGVVFEARYMGGWGNTVIILHSINGETYSTLYAHLSSISVSPNQVVQAGETVGIMGSTGDSTGPHLHFEVHKGGFAGHGINAVDPLPYIINP